MGQVTDTEVHRLLSLQDKPFSKRGKVRDQEGTPKLGVCGEKRFKVSSQKDREDGPRWLLLFFTKKFGFHNVTNKIETFKESLYMFSSFSIYNVHYKIENYTE